MRQGLGGAGLRHQGNAGSGRNGDGTNHALITVLGSPGMVRMFCPRSSRCLANEYRSGGGPECRIPYYASGSAGGIAKSIRVQHSDTCEPVRMAFVHRTVTIGKMTANVVDIGHTPCHGRPRLPGATNSSNQAAGMLGCSAR